MRHEMLLLKKPNNRIHNKEGEVDRKRKLGPARSREREEREEDGGGRGRAAA